MEFEAKASTAEVGEVSVSAKATGNKPFAVEVRDLHKYFGELEVLKGVDVEASRLHDWLFGLGQEHLFALH